MTINVPEFKPTFLESAPAANLSPLEMDIPQMLERMQGYWMERSQTPMASEPSYKQKERTEICKFWLNGQECKFGEECAFAHGSEQLLKKTHVASKFRMTLCKSYLHGNCQYGSRCQFSHPSVDFSDFESQRTRY